MGASSVHADIVKCRSLILAGTDDEPRLFASVGDDGEVSIDLHDLLGRVRVKLAVDGQTPSVTLYDSTGQLRATVAIVADTLVVGATDQNGNPIST